jgi:hypothetical protein
MKKQIIKSGIGVKDIQNKDAVAKLVKAALPHHEAHIDTFDDAAYHYPLDGRKQRRQESFLIGPPFRHARRSSLSQARA